MNVKSVEKEATRASVTVELTREELEPALNRAYLKYRKDIMIPGFRKGHAPRMVIEAAYGKHVFFEDAVEDMFPDIYKDAVLTQDIRPVGRPSVSKMDIADDGAVTLTIVTDLYPVAELGEYKNLEIEKAEVEVKESEVEAELDRMAQNVARITTVDRPAQEGDTAVIDFEGFENGKAFAGGKGENYELKLGSHTFIPGFEEQVAGMSAGEEKDIDVTFPADYHAEELAGKPVVFKVKVHEVKETVVPEKDDEFVKDVSEFDTVAELRADIEKRIRDEKQAGIDRAFENAAVEKAAANMTVEIPEPMILAKLDEQLRNYISTMGISPELTREQVLASMGLDEKTFQEIMRPQAVFELQTDLLLDAIVKAENIELDEGELDETYNKMAEEYKMEVDKIKQYVDEKIIVLDMKRRKAAQLIRDTAVDKEPEAKEEAAETKEEAAE